MIALDQLTTPQDGSIEVPAGWRMGRGAYGGFVVATLIRAIEQHVGEPGRTVRSLTAELPAPVASGPAQLVVERLRRGNAVTTARAALIQSGETRGHAVAIVAAARPSAPRWNDLVAPVAPSWTTLEPGIAGPGSPEFMQHFEYWFVSGRPNQGGASPVLGWVRPRVPGAARDAAYLATVIDAWYPQAMVRLSTHHAMATIAFTLDVVGDVDDAVDAPLLYRGSAPVAADGYFVETRELWTADGRLVALNHQTFAILT